MIGFIFGFAIDLIEVPSVNQPMDPNTERGLTVSGGRTFDRIAWLLTLITVLAIVVFIPTSTGGNPPPADAQGLIPLVLVTDVVAPDPWNLSRLTQPRQVPFSPILHGDENP